MGLFDMLLGGHHGGNRQGGHHGSDHHGGGHRDYGWGHGNACDNGRDGPPPPRNAGLPPEASATLACPACRTGNSATARFCQQCGISLIPGKCTQCSATLAGGSKFCAQCGKACS